MITTIHTKAGEIDKSFIEAIKKLFKNKPIKVTIEDEMDETEYLMLDPSNKDFLMRSIRQAEDDELVTVSTDDLK